MIECIITVVLASCYFTLQLFYLIHWLRTPDITVPDSFTPTLAVTVIVVAHNEEDSIGRCIDSILKQNYPTPLMEIIIVNDRSEDKTVEILDRFSGPNLTLLHLHEHPEFIHLTAYKKSAIELAVHHARKDWMVMTDADCVLQPDWLRTIAFHKTNNDPVFITSPVILNSNHSLLQKMQLMENLTFMIVTAAGIRSMLHDIANGANMSFSKTAFEHVKGYGGNYQYASGDDMFLIEKMRFAFPDQIGFIKSMTAVATTEPKLTWASLLRQRIRWAYKNKGLKSARIQVIWGFVGFYYLVMAGLLLIPLFSKVSFIPFMIMLFVKWIADAMVVNTASRFFGKRFSIVEFVLLQFVYGYYLVRLGMEMMIRKKGDW